jgi:probable HAF family extracellular repeat protein
LFWAQKGHQNATHALEGETVKSLFSFSVVAAFLTNAAATVLAQSAPQFAITDLGTLGGTTGITYNMNKAGHVIGWSTTADGFPHSFIWTPEAGMTDLGTNAKRQVLTKTISEVFQFMANGGARPGAGRPKGSRNKAPKRVQYGVRAIAAEVLPALGRPPPGKKLGKEVLEEFMMVARGMAAKYQPAPPGQPKKPGQNETKFLTYAEMAIKCASELAPYQSPKFKAIAVRVEDAVTQPRRVRRPKMMPTFCSSRPIQSRQADCICASCRPSTKRHDRWTSATSVASTRVQLVHVLPSAKTLQVLSVERDLAIVS